MEIWDAYNEDGTKAGCDLIRGDKIPDNLYHLVSEVIVRHKDGDYLLMQRDFNKESNPGIYEATAAGSALKGETSDECAKRELKEETGIDAEKLELLYKCINKERHGLYYGYLCETNCNKDSIVLQEHETISYMWLNKENFLEFIDTDQFVKTRRERLSRYIEKIR